MAPTQTAENGRGRTGRFAKGNPGGPGRPRGLDFRAVVAAHAELTGFCIEGAIIEVFTALLRQAREGDVAAAKFLIERLCGKDESAEAEGPPSQLSEAERIRRIEDLLETARRRREAADTSSAAAPRACRT
ncbi:MAG: hypothetical protein JNK15_05245 [Planctomycetes bacterium]|nr:hypothetical protein [Planctomycetota bacterium]